jgi:hypothetical protein
VQNGPYITGVGSFPSIEDVRNCSIVCWDFGINAIKKCKIARCLAKESKKKDAWLKHNRLATPLANDSEDTQHTIETLPSQNIEIQTLRYIVNRLAAK